MTLIFFTYDFMDYNINNNKIVKFRMSSDQFCNLLVEEKDLKKLEELDPSQVDGFRILFRITVPCLIKFVDQENIEIKDKQDICLTILEKRVKNQLANIRIEITSQIDLYFNLIYNCNQTNFEEIKKKNSLNIKYKDFPNSLIKMFQNSRSYVKQPNQIQLMLTEDSPSILRIFQPTQYKIIELVTLGFFQADPQKANQSIVFRFNYQKAKLNLLEGSIASIYSILQSKNPSLLQYIKKTVGLV